MSVNAYAAPAAPPARSPAADDLAGKSLLQGLKLDYGPIDLLGRFFLKADTAARARGIELSFGTFEELIEVNRRNSDSWKPLVTVFDPTFGGLTRDNTFVVLGRNRRGDVVMTQAARHYNWAATNFEEEARSLRIFYPDPERQSLPGEQLDATAPTACLITGQVVFSGGVWVRPDYRGQNLTAVLPRVSRAAAYTRWASDVTTTMMSETLVAKGLAARVGYTDISWDVTFRNTRLGTLRCALLRMTTAEMLQDLERYLAADDSEVDRVVQYRTG